MKAIALTILLALLPSSAYGLTVVNKTNGTVYVAWIIVEDKNPIEVTTRGWRKIENGETAKISTPGAIGVYCKDFKGKIWRTPATGVSVRAWINQKDKFTVFFADRKNSASGEGFEFMEWQLEDNPQGKRPLNPF